MEKVQTDTVLVNQSGETLQHIIQSVNSVNESISEIATAADEQSTGIGQVKIAISRMEESTQQNAAFVEETSTSADPCPGKHNKCSSNCNYLSYKGRHNPKNLSVISGLATSSTEVFRIIANTT